MTARLAAILASSLLFAASGCALPGSGATTKPAVAATGPASVEQPQQQQQTSADPPPSIDARETAKRVFRVEIWDFSMPSGTISSDAAFWKPVDETFLGFNIHEALNKNGIRVGRVPMPEISTLFQQMQGAPIEQENVIGTGGKKEIELGPAVDGQNLFYYNPRSFHMEGRTFERSQNLYVVAYRQLPRQPDSIRVDFTPAVRELRPDLRIVDGKVEWTPPDVFYPLNITCDLHADECIVIAPSPVATQNNLVIGRAFLMENGPTQQLEHILVIVPRVAGTLRPER